MMGSDEIYLMKDANIATIYLNRPKKRNAINIHMWQTLPKLIADVASDESIRAVVLRGADNTTFSAGADISEFQHVRNDKNQARLYDAAIERATMQVRHLSKPTLALIQGYCIGAGAALALECDFRFTDSGSQFGITPAKLGIVYPFSATKRLTELVGPSRSKDMLMTGRIMDAKEAYRIGLVDQIFDPTEIITRSYAYMEQISSRAQFTIRATKTIIEKITDGVTDNTPEIESLVEGAYESADYKEGIRAFIEKRSPRF